MDEPVELIIDHIIIICKGCKRERTVWPDAPLVGAAQIKKFVDTGIPPCGCGAKLCDLKMHVKGDPDLPNGRIRLS